MLSLSFPPLSFSLPLEASMNFVYLWQLWNQIYSLLWASYTIYRRESAARPPIDKDTEICTRDTDTLIRFRYNWMEAGINGDVTRSYARIAIVKTAKARDRYARRGKIIDMIIFMYCYRSRLLFAFRTSFTIRCYSASSHWDGVGINFYSSENTCDELRRGETIENTNSNSTTAYWCFWCLYWGKV